MPSVMMAAGAVRLTTSIGETPAMPESQDQAARERRGHAAEAGGDHGEVAQTVDLHAEFGGVRRDGFVEGERGGVAGARQDAEDVRADGTADLGDFIGVRQVVDEEVDHARGAKTGGEHAGRQ